MIRLATLADVPNIVAISKPCYDQMEFDSLGWKYDADRIAESYARGVTTDNHILIVAEDNGTIIGLLFINICTESYYFKYNPFAQEIMWHVLPSLSTYRRSKYMLKMLSFAEKILAERGIKNFYLGTDLREGFNGVGKHLLKNNYQLVCTRLFKEIPL